MLKAPSLISWTYIFSELVIIFDDNNSSIMWWHVLQVTSHGIWFYMILLLNISQIQHCQTFFLFQSFFEHIKCPSFGPILNNRDMQVQGIRGGAFSIRPKNSSLRFVVAHLKKMFALDEGDKLCFQPFLPFLR